MNAVSTVRRFRYRRFPNGEVVVYDVPIFVECEKAGIRFDGAWIADAVRYHRQAERTASSFGTMHVNHNGEVGLTVAPAGAWTNTRAGKVRTKDDRLVNGILADLVFTDDEAWRRASRHQLLWRSPEIPRAAAERRSPPRLGSLALLDRHPPHNDDLPVLLLEESGGVPNEKNTPTAVPWVRENAPAVLASAQTSDSIFFLLEPDVMAAKRTKPTDSKHQDPDIKFEDDKEKKDDAPPADDKKSDGPPKKEGGEGGGGWKSKVDALKGIKLTAEDIPDFLAALQEVMDAIGGSGDAPEPPEPDEIANVPGEPPMPPDAQIPMRADNDEIVKLRADIAALQKREAAREAKIAFDQALDSAERELEGKATREEILTFAAQFADKPAAVKAYVDAIGKKVPRADASFHDAIDSVSVDDVPSEVMKFQAEGTDAYAWALQEHRLWKDAVAGRATSLKLARWLEVRRPDNTFSRTTTVE